MQIFEIEVWYRYASHGELEKEFNIHRILAYNVQDAVNKASEIYKSLATIPFKFIYNGQKYEPQQLTKNDIFNLTSPN